MSVEAIHSSGQPKPSDLGPGFVAREITSPGGGGNAQAPAGPKAIEEAIAALDWPTARKTYDKFRKFCKLPKIKFQLAGRLMDWVGVLETEPDVLREVGVSQAAEMPKQLAELSFQARMNLELEGEALALVRERRRIRPRAKDWLKWAVLEAQALARLEDYEAALAIGMQIWERKADAGAMLIAQNLVALGRRDECHQFIQSLARLRATPNIARARIANLALDPADDQGLALVRGLKGRLPDNTFYSTLARYAAQARNLDTLEDLIKQLSGWATDPERDELFRRSGPSILSYHFFCMYNWPAIRPLAEDLSRRALLPPDAVMLSRLAIRAGDYPLAERTANEGLASFPSTLSLWQQCLGVLSPRGDIEARAAARLKMKALFPARSYLAATSRNNPRNWDSDDLADMLKFNLELSGGSRQAHFFASLGEAALDEDQVNLLREATTGGPPVIVAQVDLMLAPLRDRRLLANSVMSPISFAEFDETRRYTQEAIARVTDAMSTGEMATVTAGYGMAECLRFIERMESRGKFPAVISTRESYAEATRLAQVLAQRISRGEPTSVIRIGDGDAHFLPGHPAVEEYRESDRAAIQEIWWGATRMNGDRLREIEESFVRAVDSSTILSVIPPWRFLAEMARPRHSFAHRGIFNGVAYCCSLDFQGEMMTSMHFPNDLHKWNLWREVFAATDSISYISCHKMDEFLQTEFGLSTRNAILIPGEHQYIGLFEKGETSTEEEKTLLDIHDEVCAAINPGPGEVFLVAAGFLGKIYCDIIKNRGGIAIDIGSLADYWMGFSTRRYRLEQHSRIEVTNTIIDDHPLSGLAPRARITGLDDVAHSSMDCRYNIATDSTRASLKAGAKDTRLLRVLGHPRCASAYMATLMVELGLEIGHEKLLRHGISSWMHVVSDLHVPWGDNATYNVDFEHTVAHVRDPVDAIPSIVMENGTSQSFNFRRMHILRATGVDLCDYRTALDRAVGSLVHWYDMTMNLQPEAVFRVEDAESAVRDYLKRSGLVTADHEIGTSMPRSHADQALDDEPHTDEPPEILSEGNDSEIASVNDSMRKFGRAKPVFTPESYLALDPDLWDRLKAYCDRFGYAYPWLSTTD